MRHECEIDGMHTCSTTSTAYELPLHFCEPSNFEPLYNNVLGKPNCFDCDGGGGVKSTLTGILTTNKSI